MQHRCAAKRAMTYSLWLNEQGMVRSEAFLPILLRPNIKCKFSRGGMYQFPDLNRVASSVWWSNPSRAAFSVEKKLPDLNGEIDTSHPRNVVRASISIARVA